MSDQNQYDDDLDTFDDGVDAGDSWESFDDDTDISDDELAAVGGESKKKKKSGPVSLLLIIAVLLGGGAFAYTQFSGAPTTPLSSAGEDAFADESSSMPPMPSAISAPPMAEAGDDVAGFALADEPAQDLNLAPARHRHRFLNRWSRQYLRALQGRKPKHRGFRPRMICGFVRR